MITQFASLFRVKQLREEKLLVAVEGKRRTVAEAEGHLERTRLRVAENRRAMAERERAIYARLIGRVTTTQRLERAKDFVRKLERDHQRLVDEERQADAALARLREELRDLRVRHRQSLVERDKYQTTMRRLEAAARITLEVGEEHELEEAAIARMSGFR
jgi:hypothetical protein